MRKEEGGRAKGPKRPESVYFFTSVNEPVLRRDRRRWGAVGQLRG